jgi:hypothetical protein
LNVWYFVFRFRVSENADIYREIVMIVWHAYLLIPHPRRCASPDAITPDQGYVIIAQRRGGMGGQAHVPSFIRTSILNFISREKEFYRADFAVFFS